MRTLIGGKQICFDGPRRLMWAIINLDFSAQINTHSFCQIPISLNVLGAINVPFCTPFHSKYYYLYYGSLFDYH